LTGDLKAKGAPLGRGARAVPGIVLDIVGPLSGKDFCGRVKWNARTAISWGGGKSYGIAEMTEGKLSYKFRRSLLCNDKATLSQGHDAIGFLFFRSLQ
jgi:hypothetical protein